MSTWSHLPPNSPFPITCCSLRSLLFIDQPPVGHLKRKHHVAETQQARHTSHSQIEDSDVYELIAKKWQTETYSWKTHPERPPSPPPALALLVWCTGHLHLWCSATNNVNVILKNMKIKWQLQHYTTIVFYIKRLILCFKSCRFITTRKIWS